MTSANRFSIMGEKQFIGAYLISLKLSNSQMKTCFTILFEQSRLKICNMLAFRSSHRRKKNFSRRRKAFRNPQQKTSKETQEQKK